jgi:hypothetical protein
MKLSVRNIAGIKTRIMCVYRGVLSLEKWLLVNFLFRCLVLYRKTTKNKFLQSKKNIFLQLKTNKLGVFCLIFIKRSLYFWLIIGQNKIFLLTFLPNLFWHNFLRKGEINILLSETIIPRKQIFAGMFLGLVSLKFVHMVQKFWVFSEQEVKNQAKA